MKQGARAHLAGLVLGLAFVVVTPALGREPSDLPAAPPDDAATDPRTGMHTNAVPDIRGPGHVTTRANVWLKATNIGIMGNAFPGLSSDPAAQWPGPSGVEYLYYWGLWVGGIDPTAAVPEDRLRVSTSIEWRPPSLDPVDRIYTTADGTSGGFRGVDDDHDGTIDEDFLNGRDDDGDGAVDEDFAAVSDQMFSFEMRDDTPQAVGTGAGPHRPLGLRVRASVLAFSGAEAKDFVAVQYEIANVSDHAIDSVFVGFLVDQDVGPVANPGYWRDDLPDPRIPSRIYDEPVPPSDVRYDPGIDLEHMGGFCTRTTHRVVGFTMTDDDGDEGRTPGASTFLLLDHPTNTPFFRAPRSVGFRAFHLYRPGVAYAQGGAPTVDAERYRALSVPSGVAGGAPALPRPANEEKGDWSALASVGPFVHLEPGQSFQVVVALGVWPLDYAQPIDVPGDPDTPNPKRYKAVLEGSEKAQLLYRGQFQIPPPGTPTPQARGRETYVVAPPDHAIEVGDCHYDSLKSPRYHPAGTSYWYNFNCDYCDAVKGQLRHHWVLPATPRAPELSITPGVHEVRLAWDNMGEVIPDHSVAVLEPERGAYSFWGYRVYRAAGYTRPVGTTGPSDDQWELLAELRHYDRYEPLIDSVDVDQDGRFDVVTAIADVLLDRETGRRYFAQDLPPRTDPATGDTLFQIGVRLYFDRTCHCNQTLTNYKVPVYPVGRYGYMDPNVLDGFIYFYAVTAVDSSGAPGVDGSTGSIAMRESRKTAVEGAGVIPHGAAATSAESRVYVVPNPYRGRAGWDLTPSPSDPTGRHVDFLNMPRGAWTLRIYTIAGDLVEEIHNDDTQSNGRPQQESPDDGQASWNLISRNGQDVTSGIYLFSVASTMGTQRGKFVLIR